MPSTGGASIDPAVFGYIRVSQVEGESGLATQHRILNDHGLRDDRIFTDVASGKNMRRPSWRTLREMLKPEDTVVVPRIDRLARNLTEGLKTIEELHDQGINIRSLAEGLNTGDDSPTSRLMLHMLLSLAEWERDTIRDRIRAGVDRAAAEGRTGGRPPALSPEKVEAVRGFLGNGGSVSAAARTFGGEPPYCARRQRWDLRGLSRQDLTPACRSLLAGGDLRELCSWYEEWASLRPSTVT